MLLYIPIIALISSFLLIKLNSKKLFLNKYTIFLLVFNFIICKLIIRFTGISKIVSIMFFSTPIFNTNDLFNFDGKIIKESLRGNAK